MKYDNKVVSLPKKNDDHRLHLWFCMNLFRVEKPNRPLRLGLESSKHFKHYP